MALCAIKDICDLFYGYSFNSSSYVENGNAVAIQSASFEKKSSQVVNEGQEYFVETFLDFVLKPEFAHRQVNVANLNPDKTIQEGDVLFRSRASSFKELKALTPFDVSLDFSSGKPFIASNAFIVMRPNSRIIKKYLIWALNNFRNDLRQQVSKSGIASIHTVNIRQLKEIIIPVPSLTTQKNITCAIEEIEALRALNSAIEETTNDLLRGLAKEHGTEFEIHG